MEKKKKPISKRKTLLLITGVAMAILIGFWIWKSFIQTYPLGDNKQITFIGRQHYGYLIGLADSTPGTTYFYETDLTPPELVEYFKKASVTRPDEVKIWKNMGDKMSIGFQTERDEYFGISFYFSSRDTTKYQRFYFTLDSKYYQAAKKSL